MIEDIRLDPPPTDGFELLDIFVVGPDRSLAGLAEHGFPPAEFEGSLRPFRGATVEPQTQPYDKGTLLVIGARLDRTGVGFFRQIHVDYRIGDRQYTGRFRSGYVVCTPRSFENCGPDAIGKT